MYSGNLTSAVSITGKNATGGVPALEFLDGVFYTANGAPFASLGSTADARAGFVVAGPSASPANAVEGTVTVTAKANYSNVVNEIFLYNATTKTYDLLATPLLTTSEQTFTINLSATQAPKYIDGSGNVVVLTRALLPRSQYSGNNVNFLYSVDQVTVSYGFNQTSTGGGPVGAQVR
jgi:hypothetical protein